MRRCNMATVMKMSGYEIEREVVAIEEYDDEVLNAGWNPQLVLASEGPVAGDRHRAIPDEMANVDVETFLQKMYEYQR
jgi:hypothetical protein